MLSPHFSCKKFGGFKIKLYFCSTRTPKPLNDAQIGGRFIFIPMSIQFDKTYTHPFEIIALLKGRGLNIEDGGRSITSGTSAIIGSVPICILCCKYPRRHIATKQAAHSKTHSTCTVLTRSYGCSSSTR